MVDISERLTRELSDRYRLDRELGAERFLSEIKNGRAGDHRGSDVYALGW